MIIRGISMNDNNKSESFNNITLIVYPLQYVLIINKLWSVTDSVAM